MDGVQLGTAIAVGSEIVIVISPVKAGSLVSNSSTSTICSFGTSLANRPW
jgi:hypothetical protein